MNAIFIFFKYFFKKIGFVLKIFIFLHPHSELE
jgi:hypothetical protein